MANYFKWNITDTKPTWNSGPATNTPAAVSANTTIVTSGYARAGTKFGRMQIIGNDSGNQQAGFDLITSVPNYPFNVIRAANPLYYRCWMRVQPGFSWGSGTAKAKCSRSAGVTVSRVCTNYFTKTGFTVGETDGAGGGTGPAVVPTDYNVANTDTNVRVDYDLEAMDDGLWHEYVFKVTSNTVTGANIGSLTDLTSQDAVFEVFVDGVSIGSITNWRLHNTSGNVQYEQWGSIMCYPYFQLNGTASDGGTIDVNDFDTSDTYNSCFRYGRVLDVAVS